MSSDLRIDRREFLRGLGRALALGTLLVGGAGLASKPRKHSESCAGDGVCGRCGSLDDCGLPQALSARRGMAGEKQR